jgi:hypothetical protein
MNEGSSAKAGLSATLPGMQFDDTEDGVRNSAAAGSA